MVEIVSWHEDREAFSPWQSYLYITVTYYGVPYTVCTVVGVPEWEIGSAMAAGCTPGHARQFVSAWWSDSSDWSELPNAEVAEEVLAELDDSSPGLWRDALARRRKEGEQTCN